MPIIFLLELLFFVSPVAYSLDLEEIRSLAISNSQSLEAKQMESHALASERDLKGKWQNPQLMGQFGTLKSGDITGSTVEISLTQAVPLSDKFSLRKELAEQALKTQGLQTKHFVNWVEHQAVLAAWRVIVAKELFSHGMERAERIRVIQKYLGTRPRVSIKQKVELSIISSLVLQLLKMQDEKKHELTLAEKDLEFWIGRKVSAKDLSFHLPSDSKILIPDANGKDGDIELLEAKNQLTYSKLDSELASKERRPDFYLGGGYRVENVQPVNHFSYAIVGLNIPIWDTGSLRAQSANARKKRDEKYLEEAERRVFIKHQKQLELVLFNISQIKRFPKKLLNIQEDSIHLAEAGFKQGLLDVDTFLRAETQTHDVIDQIFISWMGYLDSLSSLQLMRGEKFAWEAK